MKRGPRRQPPPPPFEPVEGGVYVPIANGYRSGPVEVTRVALNTVRYRRHKKGGLHNGGKRRSEAQHKVSKVKFVHTFAPYGPTPARPVEAEGRATVRTVALAGAHVEEPPKYGQCRSPEPMQIYPVDPTADAPPPSGALPAHPADAADPAEAAVRA